MSDPRHPVRVRVRVGVRVGVRVRAKEGRVRARVPLAPHKTPVGVGLG